MSTESQMKYKDTKFELVTEFKECSLMWNWNTDSFCVIFQDRTIKEASPFFLLRIIEDMKSKIERLESS